MHSDAEQALFESIRDKDQKALRRAVAKGANVNALDDSNKTPLHYAALSGDVSLCRSLVQLGASIDATDVLGWTPLYFAVVADAPLVCALLVRSGAGTGALIDRGLTPFDFASQACCKAMLLAAGYRLLEE